MLSLYFINTISIFIISAYLQISLCQFPKACQNNATRPGARCCPIPPGFSVPCGGQGRGHCQEIKLNNELFYPPLDDFHKQDDRLNWPRRFFNYACKCQGSFGGYMCQECNFGFQGENCTDRILKTRINVLKLNSTEKIRLRNILHKAKSTQSDYVVMGAKSGLDPASSPVFHNVSVYDLFVYIHFYAARGTQQKDGSCRDTPKTKLDYAHEGCGFVTWHRHFMLFWERELQKIAKDSSFALPYWEWNGQNGDQCDICKNDLLGETDPNSKEGTLHSNSIFSTWKTICVNDLSVKCPVCDPTVGSGSIIRRPGMNPIYPYTPNKHHIKFTLNTRVFSTPPHRSSYTMNNHSFINNLEGYTTWGIDNITDKMHNQVHMFFNGTMTHVPSSPNDPAFILHHAFVDKLFEIWLRNQRPQLFEFPVVGAPAGHNRDSPMVPFFPPIFHTSYFTDSRNLGYDYDDMPSSNEINVTGDKRSLPWMLVAIMGVALVILLTVIITLSVQITKLSRTKVREAEHVSEKTPLMEDQDV